MTKTKTYLVAVTLLLGRATLAAAATTGEFDNECVMGLALGKDIATDCSVNTSPMRLAWNQCMTMKRP